MLEFSCDAFCACATIIFGFLISEHLVAAHHFKVSYGIDESSTPFQVLTVKTDLRCALQCWKTRGVCLRYNAIDTSSSGSGDSQFRCELFDNPSNSVNLVEQAGQIRLHGGKRVNAPYLTKIL